MLGRVKPGCLGQCLASSVGRTADDKGNKKPGAVAGFGVGRWRLSSALLLLAHQDLLPHFLTDDDQPGARYQGE
jgi:hypothetical protein